MIRSVEACCGCGWPSFRRFAPDHAVVQNCAAQTFFIRVDKHTVKDCVINRAPFSIGISETRDIETEKDRERDREGSVHIGNRLCVTGSAVCLVAFGFR